MLNLRRWILVLLVAALQVEATPNLLEQVKEGFIDAETFWKSLDRAPIVEFLPDSSEEVLVTFIFRADPTTTTHVAILGGVGHGVGTADNLLTHLPGTDIWYRSYRVPADMRANYGFVPNVPVFRLAELQSNTFEGVFLNVLTNLKADPLNHELYGYGSPLELPFAPVQPYIHHHPEVPAGTLYVHRMASVALENERNISVYLPAHYGSDPPYPLLLLFDGGAYTTLVPTPTILDNLIAEGLIPALVAVFIDNATPTSRNLELPCYEPMVTFLASELLPWIQEHFEVDTDPRRVVIGGSSFGGLAAAFAGLRRPDLFGNVLSQSGAFWWAPVDDGRPSWIIEEYAMATELPQKFYFDVGSRETEPSLGGSPSYVEVNSLLRDLLQIKGCDVTYAEFSGMHTYLCWRGTLSDGLIALLGGTPPSESVLR